MPVFIGGRKSRNEGTDDEAETILALAFDDRKRVASTDVGGTVGGRGLAVNLGGMCVMIDVVNALRIE